MTHDFLAIVNREFIEEIQTRKELALLFKPAISISKLVHRVSRYFTVDPERLNQRTCAPGVRFAALFVISRFVNWATMMQRLEDGWESVAQE